MGSQGLYVLGGLCLLLAVVLPQMLRRFAISSPMVLVGVGLAIGFSPIGDGWPSDPTEHAVVVEHVTELAVIVALMGVGLALDRPLSVFRRGRWRRWSAAWRLLGITMPLTIAAVALLGWWAAGIAPAAAILLGAVLAPTDPVLASDVQVGGPSVADEEEDYEVGDRPAGHGSGEGRAQEDEEDQGDETDEVRFALTAEAGLNDGLAFPFVHLGLLALGGLALGDLGLWVGWYAVGKILIGTGVGFVVGWALGRVVFRSRTYVVRLAAQSDPLLALAALLLAYGVAEVAGGYGFLSVFACAMALRAAERKHRYHREMHDVIERLERLLTLVILLLLGVATSRGLLEHLDWAGVLVGVALVFVIRPLAGLLGLAVRPRSRGEGCMNGPERLAVSFFGVRGVGSLYYLAYASTHGDLANELWLWSTVAFTIVLSVFVHGVTANPAMAWLDQRRVDVTPVGR